MDPNRRRRANRSEHCTMMFRRTMEEPAWKALSTTAQALYPWIRLEWKGPDANNNGCISLSVRQASARMGVARDTAARAFHDLQAKGFIVQTTPAILGIEGAAKSPTYEITELKMPGSSEIDGRRLYRKWKKGADFHVPKASANNPRGRNGSRKKPVLKIVKELSRKP